MSNFDLFFGAVSVIVVKLYVRDIKHELTMLIIMLRIIPLLADHRVL